MNASAIRRRSLLATAALAALARPHAGHAAPKPFDAATLVVGGPGGGGLDMWADWLAPVLGPALSPNLALHKDVVGGLDGVTAANQFEAWAVPDGSTAAMLPGAAALAWLCGDPRAKFDAARWVPALVATSPCLVVSRLSAEQVAAGAPVRLAVGAVGGKDVPAMLALDLLGARWQPVAAQENPVQAVLQQQADAVCLCGRQVAALAAGLAGSGASPLFSLGAVDDTGAPVRSADFPDVPGFLELLGDRAVSAPLLAGWRAAAAAAALNMALVLPQLTPAAMVAQWRRACAQASVAPPVQSAAAAAGLRAVPAPTASACTAAVLADTAPLLELRRWLATRLDYRPT